MGCTTSSLENTNQKRQQSSKEKKTDLNNIDLYYKWKASPTERNIKALDIALAAEKAAEKH